VKVALDVLEQQVAGQLIGAAIQPLTDRIPATVSRFLAGGAEGVPVVAALRADYAQLGMAAARLDTHAHRSETTGETLGRRSSSRNFAEGGSPIGAVLKQALESVLRDLAEQIPRVVALVQRDMARFLKRAAQELEQADEKLAADARALEALSHDCAAQYVEGGDTSRDTTICKLLAARLLRRVVTLFKGRLVRDKPAGQTGRMAWLASS